RTNRVAKEAETAGRSRASIPPSTPPYGHHRARRDGENPARDAAQEEPREARAPVRAHHDEIGPLAPGGVRDASVRQTLEKEPADARPGAPRLHDQLLELLRPVGARRPLHLT